MSVVLKFSYEGDIRRSRVPLLSLEEVFAAADRSYPELASGPGIVIKYLDDEADLCLLTETTFPDFANISAALPTIKLEVFKRPLPVHGSAARPAGGQDTPQAQGEAPMTTGVATPATQNGQQQARAWPTTAGAGRASGAPASGGPTSGGPASGRPAGAAPPPWVSGWEDFARQFLPPGAPMPPGLATVAAAAAPLISAGMATSAALPGLPGFGFLGHLSHLARHHSAAGGLAPPQTAAPTQDGAAAPATATAPGPRIGASSCPVMTCFAEALAAIHAALEVFPQLEGTRAALAEVLTSGQYEELQGVIQVFIRELPNLLPTEQSNVISMVMEQVATVAGHFEHLHPGSSPGVPVHNLVCDGCGATPIVGRAFKCMVCPNYDLCEACNGLSEAWQLHPGHEMVEHTGSHETRRGCGRHPPVGQHTRHAHSHSHSRAHGHGHRHHGFQGPDGHKQRGRRARSSSSSSSSSQSSSSSDSSRDMAAQENKKALKRARKEAKKVAKRANKEAKKAAKEAKKDAKRARKLSRHPAQDSSAAASACAASAAVGAPPQAPASGLADEDLDECVMLPFSEAQLDLLDQMGVGDRLLNAELLQMHNGDIEQVLQHFW